MKKPSSQHHFEHTFCLKGKDMDADWVEWWQVDAWEYYECHYCAETGSLTIWRVVPTASDNPEESGIRL